MRVGACRGGGIMWVSGWDKNGLFKVWPQNDVTVGAGEREGCVGGEGTGEILLGRGEGTLCERRYPV